jgi:hypothetical protein
LEIVIKQIIINGSFRGIRTNMKLSSAFHHPNLLLRQPVQLIHQFIYSRIRRLNLPRQQHLLMLQFGVLQLSIQIEHLRDERNHAVVAGDIGGVGEVDRADGELADVNFLVGTDFSGIFTSKE